MDTDDNTTQYLQRLLDRYEDTDADFQPCSIVLTTGESVLGNVWNPSDEEIVIHNPIVMYRTFDDGSDVGMPMMGFNLFNYNSDEDFHRINPSCVISISLLGETANMRYERVHKVLMQQRMENEKMDVETMASEDSLDTIGEDSEVLAFDPSKKIH